LINIPSNLVPEALAKLS